MMLQLKFVFCISLFFLSAKTLEIKLNECFQKDYVESALQQSDDLKSNVFHTVGDEFPSPQREIAYSYASVPGLKSLVKLEFKVHTAVSSLVGQQLNGTSLNRSQISRNIRNYLQDFEETTGKLLETPGRDLALIAPVDRVSWNVIASYRMIRRFRLQIIQWIASVPEDDLSQILPFPELASSLRNIYNPLGGPTEPDLENAMVAIANIHFTHDLTAKDIAEGKLADEDTGIFLKSIHCYEIGNAAISQGFFTVGIEWLELALEKVKTSLDGAMNVHMVEDALRFAQTAHDKEYENSLGFEPQFFNQLLREENRTSERVTRKHVQYEAFKGKQEPHFSVLNHYGICSGKLQMSEVKKSKLFCWLEHEIHPFWKIGPLKVEFLSVTPVEIVQYHKIFSGSFIEKLKAAASSKLLPSTVVSDTDETVASQDATMRFSATAWISEVASEYTLYASKTIETITGLKVVGDAAEDLQISAYTPGGHYTVHVDATAVDEDVQTHRVATFMIYLSDVKKGGETSFAQGGTKATPEIGSAVFWYNMLSDGEVNDFTWHGACPVIFGEKWVANKWIRYEPQEHLLCHLQPQTPLKISVNGVLPEFRIIKS